MTNTNRSVNPWLGCPSKTREAARRGYYWYYQVRYFDGKDNHSKKFRFTEGDQKSTDAALHQANMFRTNMIPKIMALGGTIKEQDNAI